MIFRMSNFRVANARATIPVDSMGAADFLPSRTQFFLLLAIYFGIHAITRALISETAGLDDSYQVLLAQKLSWGYGPQPPLYTWLVIGITRIFGASTFTLTLLKESLIFVTYALTYLNTRWLTRSHACGVVAAVALQFIPSVSWESQRDLTNTVLTSTVVMLTLFIFFRLNSNRWQSYFWLGICAGLGVLSKYNYLIFYAALLAGAVSLPGLRRLVVNKRMWLAWLISLIVVLPNLFWIYQHPKPAFSSMYKFEIKPTLTWWQSVSRGLPWWTANAVAHVALLVGLFLLIFWRPVRQRVLHFHSENERLLARIFAGIWVIAILSVLVFKVTDFADRWLQPLFVYSPILATVLVRDHLNRVRYRIILWLGGALAVGIAIVAPGRMFLTEPLHRNEILNTSFRRLIPQMRPWINQGDFVYAQDYWLAGNLCMWFPERTIVSSEVAKLYAPPAKKCVMVWNAGDKLSVPEGVLQSVEKLTGLEPAPGGAHYVESVDKYCRTNTTRIGLLLLK